MRCNSTTTTVVNIPVIQQCSCNLCDENNKISTTSAAAAAAAKIQANPATKAQPTEKPVKPITEEKAATLSLPKGNTAAGKKNGTSSLEKTGNPETSGKPTAEFNSTTAERSDAKLNKEQSSIFHRLYNLFK